jgi:hypothetical protein
MQFGELGYERPRSCFFFRFQSVDELHLAFVFTEVLVLHGT